MSNLYDTVKELKSRYHSFGKDVNLEEGPTTVEVSTYDLARLFAVFDVEPPPIREPWKGSPLREASARLARAITPLLDGTRGHLDLYELHRAHEACLEALKTDAELERLSKTHPSDEDIDLARIEGGIVTLQHMSEDLEEKRGLGGLDISDVFESLREMYKALKAQFDIQNGDREKRAQEVRKVLDLLGSLGVSNPNVEAALYTLANAGPPPGRETQATPASLGLKDSE